MGKATQSYATDHNAGLPAAGINMPGATISWDMNLLPYLAPEGKHVESAYDKKRLLASVQHYFLCPSDLIPRQFPRSYSMSGHDMKYWPPGPDNKTGVGLWWDKQNVTVLDKDKSGEVADNPASEDVLQDPELLPALKISMLPDPKNTLLLTELIKQDNRMQSLWSVRVFSRDQVEGSNFHLGKFNYLMIDGHAESLNQPLSEGKDGKHPNIWTIKAGD